MATYTDKFTKGMKVGSELHMDFEVREMTTADMLDAEIEVSTSKPLNYTAALASLQLVRVGTYEGPFTLKMVRSLDPVDFNILRAALNKVAALGEDQSPGTKTT